MRIFFACPLEADPVRGHLWKAPRLHFLANSIGPINFDFSTDLGSANGAMAVGVAEVDAAQLAVLEADPQIVVVTEAERDTPLRNLSTAKRSRMAQLTGRLGGVSQNDTAHGVLNSLAEAIDGQPLSNREGRVSVRQVRIQTRFRVK